MALPLSSVAILSPEATDVSNLTGAKARHAPCGVRKTFHAFGSVESGAGAAQIQIQVSNQKTPTNWITLRTLDLTLSSTVDENGQDGFADNDAWRHVRAVLLSVSGTVAQVSCWMAVEE